VKAASTWGGPRRRTSTRNRSARSASAYARVPSRARNAGSESERVVGGRSDRSLRCAVAGELEAHQSVFPGLQALTNGQLPSANGRKACSAGVVAIAFR
jgi:hypothetical protein